MTVYRGRRSTSRDNLKSRKLILMCAQSHTVKLLKLTHTGFQPWVV
jgi:hypothetical protein